MKPSASDIKFIKGYHKNISNFEENPCVEHDCQKRQSPRKKFCKSGLKYCYKKQQVRILNFLDPYSARKMLNHLDTIQERYMEGDEGCNKILQKD